MILGQVQEGGHGPDQIARGIAFDLGAEFSIPLMASSHQVLRRDGGDHVVDRDAVVVERHIQTRHRRRRIGETQGQGVCRFRHKVRISPTIIQQIDRLVVPRVIDVIPTRGALGKELGQVGRTDVA
ncbi:hypothetical protein D3C87_1763600 [compost metagenome]